jgi:DNA (cytosine-5)-methyltransferase 1
MTTVELFAGIGGFRLAAERRGLRTVWANDHCPRACAVYRDHFGRGELREGDLARFWAEVPPHDLLTAGFPCQPFSSAGKKQGVRDPRGTLFELIVRALRRHQPTYFVLENVKRLLTMEEGLHFAAILRSLAGLNYRIEWRLLNAMHFGLSQNRQRVFLLGVRGDRTGGPGAGLIRLAPGADLEGLKDGQREALRDVAAWRRVEDHGKRFSTWGLAQDDRFFAADLPEFSARSDQVPVRAILQEVVPPEFDFTEATLRWVDTNTPVRRFLQGVEILSNQGGGARMGYTIFGVNGVAPTLTSTTSRHYERYQIGDRYRRLTNVEYARIQGFPDDHCRAASVYDQYALLGNAVPPPMAGWVLGRITDAGVSASSLGRLPNDNEWQRFLTSPLDGLIGMSFALQWRYDFGKLFGAGEGEAEGEG